jgi:hypothetical protein
MGGRKRKSDVLEASGSAISSPPTKKSRRKKDPNDDDSKPEKRLAKFKPKCPQNILERVDRVMSQRYAFQKHFESLVVDSGRQVLHD